MLIVRDGWGFNPDYQWNAIAEAPTPHHDRYLRQYPSCLISASGEAVGLPPQNQGSSEVGHLNLGAGRVVYQSLVRISKEIADGNFAQNPVVIAAMEKARKNNCRIHLFGLVQDQGVHSHNDHAKGVMELAAKYKIPRENLLLHAFSDGRDTPPRSARIYLEDLEKAMEKSGVGVFASLVGRYFSMDRDNRWDRVQKAYNLLSGMENFPEFDTVYDALEDGYAKGENDEFILPRRTKHFHPISDGDVVIFFNYRLDRTREITRAFIQDGFSEFPVREIKDLTYIGFTEYYDGMEKSSRASVGVVFRPLALTNIFPEYLSKKNMTQLRIAETEKFAHVTFFFNGQSDVIFPGEDRELIPSPQVATYDLQPEMSAHQVKDKTIEMVNSGKYDVIILNFANPDMVGHTGIYEAALKATAVVDECVGAVVNAVLAKDGVVFLTSDHGNVDQMKNYETRKPMTSHTTNLVWLHVISRRENLQKNRVSLLPSGGRLADVIPTMMEVMGLEKPPEMTGESLLIKNG